MASAETLMRQAPMTIEVYLHAVVEMLDKQFRNGYAERNPDLVGALVIACTRDFQTCMASRAKDDVDL